MKKLNKWSLSPLLALFAASLCGSPPLAAEEDVQAAPTNTAAWVLARYAVALKYEDLPANVVANAKERILDTLGTALGAYDAPSMVALRRVVTAEGGTRESTLIGSGQRTSAVNATWVNGSMIRYLDFNDTYWSTKGYMHPSNSIAEALAVAERQHASGKDLILATVLAYEIQARLADTFAWGKFEQHSGAGFTAPIVAGKLLGLNEEQMANAIGLGASHNFALLGDYGVGYTSNMKAFGYAAGSGSGVFAALLAQQGFTGPVTIIETFDTAFMNGTSLEPLISRRKDFAILQAEMKPFEAYHISHSAITGVIALTKAHHLQPDQIAKILVRGLPNRVSGEAIRNNVIPLTKEDADHNLAYLLSMAMLEGAVGPDQYARQQWKDPRAQELMRKVWLQGDAEMTKDFPAHWPCDVTITTTDGEVYSQHVDLPKGNPGNPMTAGDIDAKFSTMALKLMPEAQVNQLIATIRHLETLRDVTTLANLLRATKH